MFIKLINLEYPCLRIKLLKKYFYMLNQNSNFTDSMFKSSLIVTE